MEFSNTSSPFDFFWHNAVACNNAAEPHVALTNNSEDDLLFDTELWWQNPSSDDIFKSNPYGDFPSLLCEAHWTSELRTGWTFPSLPFDSKASQSIRDTTADKISSATSYRLNEDAFLSSPQKRGPKAATMTDEQWKSASDRIRHLWVVKQNNYNQIRSTINKEFGFNASLRQYKDRVKKLGLQRNCSNNERKAILKQVRYRREKLGKESRHIQVRGHMLSEAKVARWWKESSLVRSLENLKSPSPLPSEISIRTASRSNSHIDARIALCNKVTSTNQNIASRLLSAAQQTKCVIDEQEVRSIFGDVQKLLESRNDPVEVEWGSAWRPKLEPDLLQIRNTMNLQARLTVGSEPPNSKNNDFAASSLIANRLRKQDMRTATWHSDSGRMELMFWTTNNRSQHGNDFVIHPSPMNAEIALYTGSNTNNPVRINLEYNPAERIPMKLTCQAMVPNDSEIWRIVTTGNVQALINLLKTGQASLADRDEEGRSLLSYATTNAEVEMCRFLLSNGANPNSMEVNDFGYMSPVHHHHHILACDSNNEHARKRTQCREVMLDFDADPSLEIFNGESWRSSFEDVLVFGSCASLKSALLRGEPFITTDTKVITSATAQPVSPLIALANICRYKTQDILEVLDKAMLFLPRGADVTCTDEQNNNALHCILQAPPDSALAGRELQAGQLMPKICRCQRCNAPFQEPEAFLIAAITAGVDIYAINDHGNTATTVAENYGRHDEWCSALEECGIDSDEVWLHTQAWETVLESSEVDYLALSLDEKAKLFQKFNSDFWNEEHSFQQSSLTFEQFRQWRNERNGRTINCQYPKPQQNYTYMTQLLPDILEDDDDGAREVEGLHNSSPSSLRETTEKAADKKVIPSPELSDSESIKNGHIPSFIDTSLFSDAIQGFEDEDLENGYTVDMSGTDLNNPFQLESMEVIEGTSNLSFEAFMDLGMPEAFPDDYFQSALCGYGDLNMDVL